MLATTKHMFHDCIFAYDIWKTVNELGHLVWPKYSDFDYNEIPALLNWYSPPMLLQASALWAMWRVWCNYFYETDPELQVLDDYIKWYNTTIDYIKEFLLKRLYEAGPMIKWIQIIQDRRESRRDDPELNAPFIPEKEFLLVYSQAIDANPSYTTPSGGDRAYNPDASFEAWVGNATLFSFDDPNSQHKKIKIDHSKWPAHRTAPGRPPDPPIDSHAVSPRYIQSVLPISH